MLDTKNYTANLVHEPDEPTEEELQRQDEEWYNSLSIEERQEIDQRGEEWFESACVSLNNAVARACKGHTLGSRKYNTKKDKLIKSNAIYRYIDAVLSQKNKQPQNKTSSTCMNRSRSRSYRSPRRSASTAASSPGDEGGGGSGSGDPDPPKRRSIAPHSLSNQLQKNRFLSLWLNHGCCCMERRWVSCPILPQRRRITSVFRPRK